MSEGLADWLHAESEPVWRELHEHPFLRELATGELPLEAFRFYLEQNLRYLPEYARTIAMGAGKAADLEQLEWFEEALVNIVRNELPANRRLLEQTTALGAEDRGGAAAMSPANRAYTGFLLSAAWQGGTLEILTAIMPCAWSYGEIATRLAPSIVAHPVYSDWIGFFASEEYARHVEILRRRLDRLGEGADARTRARLLGLFLEASQLEHGFWDMAYGALADESAMRR